MLIRRDVWDQVGGFDPNLPLMRDDLDFCWRVHAAGYDVRVITDAVVYHRDLSARQIRKAPAAGGHPRLRGPARRALRIRGQRALRPHARHRGRLRGRLTAAGGLFPAHQAAAQGLGPPRRGRLAAASPGPARGEPAAAAPPTAGTRGRSCAVSCRGAGRWPGWPNRPRACCPAGPAYDGGGAASGPRRRGRRRHAAACRRFGGPAGADQPGRPAVRRSHPRRAGRGAFAGWLGADRFGHAQRRGPRARLGRRERSVARVPGGLSRRGPRARPPARRPTSA